MGSPEILAAISGVRVHVCVVLLVCAVVEGGWGGGRICEVHGCMGL